MKEEKTVPAVEDTAFLIEFIQQHAERTEEAMLIDLESALAENDPLLLEVLKYSLLKGGKRLRPVLAILSSRLCGRDDDDNLYLLAATFEYLHAGSLIHDDVIDHAENRRGKESVVKKYGIAAAILAGDWLHARCMYLVGTLAGQKGLDIVCNATQYMVDGEFLQLRYSANTTVTEEQYFAVVLRKTAGLISATCEIGALYGNAHPEQQRSLACYGEKIGIAFQIIDDLLDYLGDEEVTGKVVGNDFIEGKMTLPLIHALAHASGSDKAELIKAVENTNRDSAGCARARQLMHAADSFAFSRQRACQETEKGIAALSCFDNRQHRESLTILEQLAGYILRRDR
ncbi:octaprenyl-diphosphate synthase [Candidatus Electrothrix aarhusensis]|uniref:Octaprenyl-diphosphate synthase n=1 Tax=Candidatus Electrothrix aarhusensis TaxID=1859131 RepID=A0A444ISI1_9BACT|nr:octaprenyl-diphosphate synthase [Candidatus Electrothrix aarhusensis]